MSRKKAVVPPKDAVGIQRATPDETDADALARTILRPSISAAVTTKAFTKVSGLDLEIPALVDALAAQCKQASEGNLDRAEAMLVAQAHSLDAIFNKLAQYAAKAEYMKNLDTYLRLALKAQSQCRATLETLAAIKNPPVVIARQANIAHGPQQVNNGFDTHTHAHAQAREIQSEPIKQLEQSHGQRLDPGAAGQAVGSDPAMATVGAFDRPTY